MAEPLFIGVDGGGTQCRARLCDASGKVLGEGRGGPANVRLGAASAMQSVLAASRAAAEAARLSADELSRTRAGMGLAGAVLGEARQAFLAEPNPFASLMVETDAHVAWLGAFGGQDGGILIVGTGSCGLAMVGGRRFDVGGWGAEISDEASGNWIGREAVRRALWAYDGRAEKTPLADAILLRLGGSGEAAVAFATRAGPADYAALATLVFAEAKAGDPLAVALVNEAATDAARMIARLLEVGAPSVCLIGGLAALLSACLPEESRAHVTEPLGDALDGALLLARRGMPSGLAAMEAL
jgi:glucosamine kinase